MPEIPPRFDVFGTKVSRTTVEEVADLILARSAVTVVIANVHSVMTSRKDRGLATALAAADVVTPDGVPLTWALRLDGHEAVRVTGIDVLSDVTDRGRDVGLCHYLYGSTPETLEAMSAALSRSYPGVQFVGTLAPPFRALSDDEISGHAAAIMATGADVVWVGMGMPKQELWMHRVRPLLPGVSLVGIGAAFDWVAGNQPMAPQWMRDRGLEWLFRLSREPRRLWRRYAYNNPAFLVLLGRKWIGARLARD